MVKYTVCISHYNNVETLRDSLDSILGQTDDTFEVIVVDNQSDDGSEKVLQEYQNEGKIRLITKRCTRGQGRQIGLENSSGEYIVSHIDMDDVYGRKLKDLLSFYHQKCEAKVMVAISSPGIWNQNVTIGPKELIAKIGGWRDLQWGDDWDLWSRASLSFSYRWTVFPIAEMHRDRKSRTGVSRKLRFRFRKYRDGMKLGREVFRKEEEVSLSQRAIKLLARISLTIYPSAIKGQNRNFRAADLAFFVS